MLLSWLLLLLHPFYVSVTDVVYNKQEKSLEITVRAFTDDLEQALQLKYPAEKVDVMQPSKKPRTDTLISNYLQSKLHINTGGKPCKLSYLGSEIVEESTWSYFAVDNITEVHTVNISNSILYELRKQQINMHNITVGGQSKSRKLDNPDTEVSFTF